MCPPPLVDRSTTYTCNVVWYPWTYNGTGFSCVFTPEIPKTTFVYIHDILYREVTRPLHSNRKVGYILHHTSIVVVTVTSSSKQMCHTQIKRSFRMIPSPVSSSLIHPEVAILSNGSQSGAALFRQASLCCGGTGYAAIVRSNRRRSAVQTAPFFVAAGGGDGRPWEQGRGGGQ